MNERVMQFRIGMFVIVAGLVLTMLIVWFGESPALFRAQTFVTVHFTEAPGVSEGIPVRKSGIRVGEVTAIRFDDRPGQPDGVLVTIALEKKYKIRAGSVPRIARALIGDVSIDLMPGNGDGLLVGSDRPAGAPVIEGAVAPDPANALAAATDAFQNVKGTLESIDEAAKGIAVVAKKAQNVDQFLASIRDLADQLKKLVVSSSEDFPAAIANLRQVSDKLNTTLDSKAMAELRSTIKQLSSGSARLDSILSDARPFVQDLSLEPGRTPTTNLGQTVVRLNGIAYDIRMLTSHLVATGPDGRPTLNRNGTVQRLFVDDELYRNFNGMAISGREVMTGAKTILANFREFSSKIANDPSVLARGALSR